MSSLELDGPVVAGEPEEEVLPRVEDQDQLGRPKISAVLTVSVCFGRVCMFWSVVRELIVDQDLVGVLRRWLALLVLDAHNADARK